MSTLTTESARPDHNTRVVICHSKRGRIDTSYPIRAGRKDHIREEAGNADTVERWVRIDIIIRAVS